MTIQGDLAWEHGLFAISCPVEGKQQCNNTQQVYWKLGGRFITRKSAVSKFSASLNSKSLCRPTCRLFAKSSQRVFQLP